MMNFDVFISYSHHDKAVADAACAALENARIRCWIAPRDILPGADWGASIVDAIDSCRAMVLIFSSHANGSPQIRNEVVRAVSKGVPIIPVRIENIEPVKALAYYMGAVHWLDALTPPLEAHLKYLTASIEALLQIEPLVQLKAEEELPIPPEPAPPEPALMQEPSAEIPLVEAKASETEAPPPPHTATSELSTEASIAKPALVEEGSAPAPTDEASDVAAAPQPRQDETLAPATMDAADISILARSATGTEEVGHSAEDASRRSWLTRKNLFFLIAFLGLSIGFIVLAIVANFNAPSPQPVVSENPPAVVPRAAPVPAPQQSGTSGAIFSVAFSPDGRWVASGSAEGRIKLWDAASGRLLRTLEGYILYDDVLSVAFSPDGHTIASGDRHPTIKLWDAAGGELLRALGGHTNPVLSVTFSPDGRTIASGGADGKINLWDAASGELLKTFQGRGYVHSVVFSPDGHMIASANGVDSGRYEATIKLWDAGSGALLKTLEGHGGPVNSVAFSPDGSTLASGSDDKTIKLWDVASGGLLMTLEGHTYSVETVAFSPDGRTIASGSDTIKLWDAASGKLLRTLEEGGTVHSVAFSPNGHTIVSGSWDKTIKLWDAASGRLLRTF